MNKTVDSVCKWVFFSAGAVCLLAALVGLVYWVISMIRLEASPVLVVMFSSGVIAFLALLIGTINREKW